MSFCLGERSAFSTLSAVAYLNHASVSPLSDPVRAAVEEMVRDLSREGMAAVLRKLERVDDFRAQVGSLFGTAKENVGFVPNTTTGVITVALSIPWKPGDRVVVFDEEFPANVTPWRQAAELFSLDLQVAPAAPFRRSLEEGLAAFDAVAGDRVRLVAVSLVQFQTGFRMPVDALAARAHALGGEILVDGIQGLGVVPFSMDTAGVDYLAAGGHKWLLSIQGGGLLLAQKRAAEAFQPRAFGWMSHENPFAFLTDGPGLLQVERPFKKTAAVVEGGSPCTVAYCALEASLSILAELGIEEVFDHVQRYHDQLEPFLVERGFRSMRATDRDCRSGSLCFVPPKEVGLGQLAAKLRERGVMVSTPDGYLRFAPHWSNPVSEIPEVVAALDST